MKSRRVIINSALVMVVASVLSRPAHAVLLQILHTNDMHSHIEASVPTDEHPISVGGYAAVKGTLDKFKGTAQDQNIPTLTVDAGDFTEGGILYFADQGLDSWRLMNAMGYDAVTIGNHDYITSAMDMNRVMTQSPPTFPFLGANFICPSALSAIKQHMRPYTIFNYGGVKVAVVGVTTNSLLYAWRALGCVIGSPYKAIQELMPELRSKADFVIVLSHIGLSSDQKLAQKTSADLIIGGHSHDAVQPPLLVQSQETHQMIPIVQAGFGGEFVGRMLVSLTPGRPLEILSAHLEQVTSKSPVDPTMDGLVKDVRKKFNNQFGAEWLREVIGYAGFSQIPQKKFGATPWSQLTTDALRHAAGTDFAVDVGEFSDDTAYPSGPITRERIIALYPRVFDQKQPGGWRVWTASVDGGLLDIALHEAARFNQALIVSGLTYETTVEGDGSHRIKNVRFNGKRLNPFGSYSIAVPEGLALGSTKISPLLGLILHDPKPTQVKIWTAIENEVRQRLPL